MQNKSIKKPADDDGMELKDLSEFFILGVTKDDDCVYIHSLEDDIKALEFLETLLAGFRSEVLAGISRRFMN